VAVDDDAGTGRLDRVLLGPRPQEIRRPHRGVDLHHRVPRPLPPSRGPSPKNHHQREETCASLHDRHLPWTRATNSIAGKVTKEPAIEQSASRSRLQATEAITAAPRLLRPQVLSSFSLSR